MLNRVQHDAAGNAYKKKPPRAFAARGCEPQAACTDRPWRRERGGATHAQYNGAERYIKRRAPRAFAQGARESSGDLLSRARGPGTIG
ncbi:hypothetical protein B7989_10510, partial [Fibrobacter sp. UWB5]